MPPRFFLRQQLRDSIKMVKPRQFSPHLMSGNIGEPDETDLVRY